MYTAKVEEAALARVWAAMRGRRVFTQDGEAIAVLFPGRANGGPGPDFRGALLGAEGGLVRGDVEIHLAASGWRVHGHGTDPAYNRVVLHVVARDDVGGPTRLASGARVPVLVMGIEEWDDSAGCCDVGGSAAALLEREGMLRFEERASRWRGAREPDEALYRAVLEGMGYGVDGRPYPRLARLLPWPALRDRELRETQALLLGTAGLIEQAPAEVRALWSGRARMRAESWPGPPCRPAARPVRRLLGAGALFARWMHQGPVRSLMEVLEPLPEPARAPPLLRRWATVGAEDAGLPPSPAALGAARADILAVNVLLPFLASRPGTGEWAEEAYRVYPALERDTVIRAMEARLGLAGLRLGACGQQGLHRVFRMFCSRGRQDSCSLGR